MGDPRAMSNHDTDDPTSLPHWSDPRCPHGQIPDLCQACADELDALLEYLRWGDDDDA